MTEGYMETQAAVDGNGKMNPEWKEKWLEALRSGEYKQAKGHLRGGDGFCCLGVLCDVVKEVLEVEWSAENPNLEHPDRYWFDESAAILPPSVQKLAGLSRGSPEVMVEEFGMNIQHDLAELNDDGMLFEEIAKLIEAQL